MKKNKIKEEEVNSAENNTQPSENEANEINNVTENQSENEATQQDTVDSDVNAKLAELQDKYLRLQAEFDNYRRRTLKEKAELIKTGGESVIINILPVVDDIERALVSMENTKDIEAIHEGIKLIVGKFGQFLTQNGVQEIVSVGQPLDTDKHEAVTKIPAPTEDFKGKIVDVVQKGYMLQDKVIRFAKVVVGE